jgi:hypothetical protein
VDRLRQSGRGRAARAGAMQDLVPRRYRPSGGLDLNFFGGLSPRWAVANLYGLLATKIPAKDIFDRGAHLLLEPERNLPSVFLGALQDDLARAVRSGPWAIAREADGNLYVYGANHFKVDESLTEDQRKRIRQLVYEGMSARLARAEVLGEEVFEL